jgi:hypothetical protein
VSLAVGHRRGHRSRAPIIAAACGWLLLVLPASAAADWYFTPYAAYKFGGSTTLIDLEGVAGSSPEAKAERKVTWGGSVTWLGPGVFGLEADFALTPGFFQADPVPSPLLVTSSRVTTLMVNAVVAAPLSFTGDSLRPYISGGWGLMRASTESDEAIDYTRNLSGFNIGGGAVGMLSRRAGVRWDLRYLRGIGDAEGGGTLGGPARLSFWRGSMGLTIRFDN